MIAPSTGSLDPAGGNLARGEQQGLEVGLHFTGGLNNLHLETRMFADR